MGSFLGDETAGKKELVGQNNPAHTHARQLFCHKRNQLTSASPDAGGGGTCGSGNEPDNKALQKTKRLQYKKKAYRNEATDRKKKARHPEERPRAAGRAGAA